MFITTDKYKTSEEEGEASRGQQCEGFTWDHNKEQIFPHCTCTTVMSWSFM